VGLVKRRNANETDARIIKRYVRNGRKRRTDDRFDFSQSARAFAARRRSSTSPMIASVTTVGRIDAIIKGRKRNVRLPEQSVTNYLATGAAASRRGQIDGRDKRARPVGVRPVVFREFPRAGGGVIRKFRKTEPGREYRVRAEFPVAAGELLRPE